MDTTCVGLRNIFYQHIDKWDYCGIMIPIREDQLQVAAASERFPEPLRDRALFTRGESLVGWAWAVGQSLVVNHVENKDPRFPFQSLESPTAAAAIPTLHLHTDKANGVLYVGSQQPSQGGEDVFSETDIKVLDLFARTTGEIIERISLVHRNVSGALQFASLKPTSLISEAEFREGLAKAISKLQDRAKVDNLGEDRLVILAVRVAGDDYKQIQKDYPNITAWLSNEVGQLLYRFVERELRSKKESPIIWRFSEGQFVVLVPSSFSDDHVRENLDRYLRQLGNFGISKKIEAVGWSLPFSGTELRKRKEPIPWLMSRITGAISVLPNIRQGNEYIEKGDPNNGYYQFHIAHLLDPDNAYHPRHMAIARILSTRYKEAVTEASNAISLDPTYAKSYRLNAEALTGLGAYDEALCLLDTAIDLDPADPATHVQYGQVLLLRASPGDGETAILKFKNAMRLTANSPMDQAIYLRYIGEANLLIGDFSAALEAYRQALALSPTNERARWEMLRLTTIVRNKSSTLTHET